MKFSWKDDLILGRLDRDIRAGRLFDVGKVLITSIDFVLRGCGRFRGIGKCFFRVDLCRLLRFILIFVAYFIIAVNDVSGILCIICHSELQLATCNLFGKMSK